MRPHRNRVQVESIRLVDPHACQRSHVICTHGDIAPMDDTRTRARTHTRHQSQSLRPAQTFKNNVKLMWSAWQSHQADASITSKEGRTTPTTSR
jgi:hypothetical protein